MYSILCTNIKMGQKKIRSFQHKKRHYNYNTKKKKKYVTKAKRNNYNNYYII